MSLAKVDRFMESIEASKELKSITNDVVDKNNEPLVLCDDKDSPEDFLADKNSIC